MKAAGGVNMEAKSEPYPALLGMISFMSTLDDEVFLRRAGNFPYKHAQYGQTLVGGLK